MALAAIDQNQWPVLIIILGSSLLTAVYIFRILENVFVKTADSESKNNQQSIDSKFGDAHELSLRNISPVLLILAISIIAIGIFNMLIITHILEPAL